jgi:DNA-directed RNA polymerase subunit RPC12/RpoP
MMRSVLKGEKMAGNESFVKRCLRCGHSWVKRVEGRPQVCPFCGSRYWDLPREPGLAVSQGSVQVKTEGEVPPVLEKDPGKVEKPARRKFSKPEFTEVAAYWRQEKLNDAPEVFYDYFTSKGWLVGKAPMKDWKAAARNWSRRAATQSPKQQEREAMLRVGKPPDVPRGTFPQVPDESTSSEAEIVSGVPGEGAGWSETDVARYIETHPGVDSEAVWAAFRRVQATSQ